MATVPSKPFEMTTVNNKILLIFHCAYIPSSCISVSQMGKKHSPGRLP